MSAYLKFFELSQSPFEARGQARVVLGTRAVREAFGAIRSGIEEGASRICVSGGAGLGKTSLARALPKLLGEEACVALIPDASVDWADVRTSAARQWALVGGGWGRAALVRAAAAKPLVLVIDGAERADAEFLDHLDVLLSYRTEDDRPAVQCVLLACLEHNAGESPPPLLWWLDRIQTLQLEFAPLPREGVASYLHKHLKRAGWTGDALFDESAAFAVHGHTGGVPGRIADLCERLLIEAAARGRTRIDAAFVDAIADPESADADAVRVVEGAREGVSDDEDALEARAIAELDALEATARNAVTAPLRPRGDAVDANAGVDATATLDADTTDDTSGTAAWAHDSKPGVGDDTTEAMEWTPGEATRESDDDEAEALASAGATATGDEVDPSLEAALAFFEEAAASALLPDGAACPAEADDEGAADDDAETNDVGAEANGVGAEANGAEANDIGAEANGAEAAATEDEPLGPVVDAAEAPATPFFGDDPASAWPETGERAEDEAFDPLLLPPTPEELAKLRGGTLAGWLRPLAAAAFAAIVGGIGFAVWSTGPEDGATDRAERTRSAPPVSQPPSRASRRGEPPAELFAPIGFAPAAPDGVRNATDRGSESDPGGRPEGAGEAPAGAR